MRAARALVAIACVVAAVVPTPLARRRYVDALLTRAPKQKKAPPKELMQRGAVIVKLHKPKPHSVLGISFADRPAEMGGGIFIGELHPEGLAAKSRALHVGDVVLAIDGVEVTDLSEAATQLREAVGDIELLIEKRRGARGHKRGFFGRSSGR